MRPRFLSAAALAAAILPFWPLLAQSSRAASVAAKGAPAAQTQGTPSGPSATHDSLTLGGRVIPVGSTIQGPVVVAGGNLDVRGTVEGTAIAIAGDVVIRQGGRVSGDAVAAFGDVKNAGEVGGTIRSLTGTFGASVRSLVGADGTPVEPRSPLKLALGWLAVMMLIGFGVLIFASPYLEGVVDVLGQSFWRSFVMGLIGELGVVPVIALVSVALAITVIGVLLIPFAVVALVLGVAGLATLGFVAVARLTGDGLGGASVARLSSRGSALRGVVVGLAVYMGLWLVAALLADAPVAGTVMRLLALVVTFVAVTAGFGAALLSRGGTKRDAAVVAAPAPAMDTGWQTPTPVAGIIAARRPAKPKAEAGSGR